MKNRKFNIKVYKKILDLKENWIRILNNNSDLSYYQSYYWNDILEKTYKKSLYKRFNFKIRYIYWENGVSKQIIFPMAINIKEKKFTF